jgi:SAM-dependent methyltransferase
LPESVQRALACPQCGEAIHLTSQSARCPRCNIDYPIDDRGQLDLRLQRPRQVAVEVSIGTPPQGWQSFVRPIQPNPSPELDVGSIQIPPLLRRGNRLAPELLSYFPRSQQRGMMLDLGCGHGDFRDICAHTNMEYVGIDYGGTARVLADAHALPFKDESFDFIISFAVLEHIRHPLVAMREAHRVLKRGCRFIGSVAFLEPFHLDSYYHFTPLAVHSLLTGAGFQLDQLEANPTWTGLRAMSWMSLFPHAPMWFSNLLVLPLHLLHRAWWLAGNALQRRAATSEAARQVVNTAGFRWVCSRPG